MTGPLIDLVRFIRTTVSSETYSIGKHAKTWVAFSEANPERLHIKPTFHINIPAYRMFCIGMNYDQIADDLYVRNIMHADFTTAQDTHVYPCTNKTQKLAYDMYRKSHNGIETAYYQATITRNGCTHIPTMTWLCDPTWITTWIASIEFLDKSHIRFIRVG